MTRRRGFRSRTQGAPGQGHLAKSSSGPLTKSGKRGQSEKVTGLQQLRQRLKTLDSQLNVNRYAGPEIRKKADSLRADVRRLEGGPIKNIGDLQIMLSNWPALKKLIKGEIRVSHSGKHSTYCWTLEMESRDGSAIKVMVNTNGNLMWSKYPENEKETKPIGIEIRRAVNADGR